ncbi:hypothetical protein AJ80_03966 [Polytolypa hystricis UAMH7299]|uniref:EH domain-containing protein n=1 Tax=Polytolypa hystricis (strain UAMH7299) TaxID=1447883 RepID=A0A2B7YDX3_POLH7|nr:hypothetical protein AJ80_03966 [Polytolypa hystricis UAMH7299]
MTTDLDHVPPRRNGDHDTNKPNNIQSAALRGATLAFNAQATKPTIAAPSNPGGGARKAALMANITTIKPEASEQRDPSPQRFVPVRERIQLFADNSGPPPTRSTLDADRPRNVPPTPPKPNTQQIAAQLAVGRATTRAPTVPPARTLGKRDKSILEGQVEATTPRNEAQQAPASGPISSESQGKSASKPPPVPPSRGHQNANNGSRHPPLRKEEPTLPPKPSFKDTEERPRLPPRTNTSSTNESIPWAISRSQTIQPTSDSSGFTRSTSVRTIASTIPVQRTQHLSPLPSRSSIMSQHSGRSESSSADAIAASSLASSRAPSPSKRNHPPPPPRHRRNRSRSLLHPRHGYHKDDSRTPSPQKAMRQSMRGESKSDDENARLQKSRRKKIMKIHSHKHREGDRKRWRDQITERQRKRYEGVWAANKGLLIDKSQYPDIPPTVLQGMVLNIVVRDIWSRSLLPSVILEQIWDLVSQEAVGMLSREEFVVGMWLVDQSLRGRKLPAKVSQSVWTSIS